MGDHLTIIKVGMVLQTLAFIGFMIAGFIFGFCKEHSTWPYSWLVFNILYLVFWGVIHFLKYSKRHSHAVYKATFKSDCNKKTVYIMNQKYLNWSTIVLILKAFQVVCFRIVDVKYSFMCNKNGTSLYYINKDGQFFFVEFVALLLCAVPLMAGRTLVAAVCPD